MPSMCMNFAHSSPIRTGERPGPEGGNQAGNRATGPQVQHGVDDEDAQALRAEGYDPDHPAVVAAIDLVRWDISLLRVTMGRADLPYREASPPADLPRPVSAAGLAVGAGGTVFTW